MQWGNALYKSTAAAATTTTTTTSGVGKDVVNLWGYPVRSRPQFGNLKRNWHIFWQKKDEIYLF